MPLMSIQLFKEKEKEGEEEKGAPNVQMSTMRN